MKKLLLLLVLVVSSVQSLAFDPQSFRLSHGFRTLMLEDAMHSKHSVFGADRPNLFGLSYDYTNNSVTLINKNTRNTINQVVEDYQTIGLIYGRHIEFSNGWKTQLLIRTSANTLKINNAEFSALGDTYIGMKVNLSESENSALAITPFLEIPTGNTEKLTSNDSIGVGVLGSYEYHFSRVHFLANLGFKHSKNAKYFNIDLSNRIITGLGTRVDLTENIAALLEWKGEFGLDFEDDQNPSDLLAALSYRVQPGLNTFAGVGLADFDLSSDGDAVSNDVRFVVAVKWAPEKTAGKVIKIIEKERISVKEKLSILKNVRFHTNTARLTQKSTKILDYVSGVLNENLSIIGLIYIEGHTDSVGTDESNQDLSMRRSLSVKKYLVQQRRMRAGLFRTQGYGETKPKVKENDARDRAINRRVEFNVIWK